MLGYDFDIIYRKWKQNFVANALSRKDEDVEALFCAIPIIQSDWINEERNEWKKDEEVWRLIQKLQKMPIQTIFPKIEPDNYKINQFQCISSSGRTYPLKIPHGRKRILYKSIKNYSSVEDNTF